MLDLKLLSKISNIKNYKTGDIIVEESVVDSKDMFILLTGTVGVYKNYYTDKQIRLSTIRAGNIFGEMSLFCNQPRSATVVADTDLKAISLTKENFLEFATKNPVIIFQIIELLCQRLLSTNETAATALLHKKSMDTQQGSEAVNPQPTLNSVQNSASKIPADSIKSSTAPTAIKENTPVATPPSTQPPTVKAKAAPKEEFEIPEDSILFQEGHKLYNIPEPSTYSKFVFDALRICPQCGKQFSAKLPILSKLKQETNMDADTRRHFPDFEPLWYDVLTCPHCYFSTLSDYFNLPDMYMEKNIKHLLSDIRYDVTIDFNGEKNLDKVFASYYIALQCAQCYKNFRQIKAKLWLGLSWLYNDADDTEMHEFATETAYQSFKEYYSETRMTPESEQVACLILGSLAYKQGLFEEAKRYLYISQRHKSGKSTYLDLSAKVLKLILEETE